MGTRLTMSATAEPAFACLVECAANQTCDRIQKDISSFEVKLLAGDLY